MSSAGISRFNGCKALHRHSGRLTSCTWACVCCCLRLLVVLGGPGGAPGAPSAPGAPWAPGAAAGAASGADLRGTMGMVVMSSHSQRNHFQFAARG